MQEINYMLIDQKALSDNARKISECVAVPVIGVVKHDGCGAGLFAAAQAWHQAGAAMLAVSQPQEAEALRGWGFREDILLLTPVSEEETVGRMAQLDVILTVTSTHAAQLYARCAENGPVRVHIAVDTGMGRFGFRYTDVGSIGSLYQCQALRVEGIFSHFSKAFERRYFHTGHQLKRFLKLTDALTRAGCQVGLRHIASSCAALRFPQTRLDAVRIGSALVGRLPVPVPVELERVGVFRAQILDRKTLLSGDTAGYGARCRIKRRTEALVVAVGHENGFGYVCSPDTPDLRGLLGYLRRSIRLWHQRPRIQTHDRKLALIGRVGSQYSLFHGEGSGLQPGQYVTVEVPFLFPHIRKRYVENWVEGLSMQ